MKVFPSHEPTPASGPLPFGANQRETLWRYRQAVWSPSPPVAAQADRRGETNQPARQSPNALISASRTSA